MEIKTILYSVQKSDSARNGKIYHSRCFFGRKPMRFTVRPVSLFPQCDTNTYLLRAQNAHVARKRADLRDLFNFIPLLSFHCP